MEHSIPRRKQLGCLAKVAIALAVLIGALFLMLAVDTFVGERKMLKHKGYGW